MSEFKYSSIAIITDNQFLSNEFYKIISTYNEKLKKIQFFSSPFSNIFLNTTQELEKINLRENISTDRLISEFDLIFSIHCKQIFPDRLVNSVKCINVHPGFNPTNRGWYPQVFAIINDTDIGATIHEIDTELDNGLIIAREKVEKHSYDTSLALYNRIVKTEIELLKNNIEAILKDQYNVLVPESKGNLYLKKDFNNLKEIDLDKKATYGDVINHLRALTHGNFKNAYFIDEYRNKIYISLNISKA